MDEFTLPAGWARMEGYLGRRQAASWVKYVPQGCERADRMLRVYEPKNGMRYIAEHWSREHGWTKLGAFEHPLTAMLALEVELAG